MADERRYGEEEVREIFDLAVRKDEAARPALSDEGGLTLEQLQDVGLEVGMDPGRIAQAAQAVDSRRGVLPRRTSLGMPISVGRIIDLPRPLTDGEWEILVAEFRETFGARGKLSSQGGIRDWSNGNLHVSLEPTEGGHRLRLGTLKGTGVAMNRMGMAGLAMGLILITLALLTGDIQTLRGIITLFPAMVLGTMGAGALVANAVSLPRWAREREGQMEYLAGRVHSLLDETSEDEGHGG